MRRTLALVTLLFAGCAERPAPAARAYLFEKGPYQAIYDPAGRILRLLYDGNGDRVADVVTLFGADGRPRRVEIDSDGDHVVDRWETFTEGRLESVGSARRTPGRPDLWEHVDSKGRVVRRELDEDGDGRAERVESYDLSGLTDVALDSDHDGRMDRWQEWRGGLLVREQLDTDGDGEPDLRLRYASDGRIARVEKLGRPAAPARP